MSISRGDSTALAFRERNFSLGPVAEIVGALRLQTSNLLPQRGNARPGPEPEFQWLALALRRCRFLFSKLQFYSAILAVGLIDFQLGSDYLGAFALQAIG